MEQHTPLGSVSLLFCASGKRESQQGGLNQGFLWYFKDSRFLASGNSALNSALNSAFNLPYITYAHSRQN